MWQKFSALPFFVLAFVWTEASAFACIGYPGHGILPACSIPAAAPDDKLVELDVPLSALTKGYTPIPNDPKLKARIVSVEVLTSDKPIYLILSNVDPVVFLFTGQTQHIARIIALGSTHYGAHAVGVVGIDRAKIHFAEPDYTAFTPEALQDFHITECAAVPSACKSDRFLFRYPVSQANAEAVQTSSNIYNRKIWRKWSATGTDFFLPAPAGLIPKGALDEPIGATDPQSSLRVNLVVGANGTEAFDRATIIWPPFKPKDVHDGAIYYRKVTP